MSPIIFDFIILLHMDYLDVIITGAKGRGGARSKLPGSLCQDILTCNRDLNLVADS